MNCTRCGVEHEETSKLCSKCKTYFIGKSTHVKHNKKKKQEDGSAYVALLEKQVKESQNGM